LALAPSWQLSPLLSHSAIISHHITFDVHQGHIQALYPYYLYVFVVRFMYKPRDVVMKQTLRFLLLLSLTILIVGCKLAVINVEGGEVHSDANGTCVAGLVCIVEVTDPNFSESFTAIPDTGWHFEKWNSGDGFLCAGSTDHTCTLSFQGHEESKAVEAMVASPETFYLMPIFKPYTSVITVNGKQWAQAGFFLNLTWDQINAVCPAGKCKDNGSLNGIDMTGWTWASIDDVKALFNVYIGYDALGPEADSFDDLTGEALERFFEDGLRPTADEIYKSWRVIEWRVMLRDKQPSDRVGRAHAFLVYEREDGALDVASFAVVFEDDDEAAYQAGAAFYR
jgi:hypothetical protein